MWDIFNFILQCLHSTDTYCLWELLTAVHNNRPFISRIMKVYMLYEPITIPLSDSKQQILFFLDHIDLHTHTMNIYRYIHSSRICGVYLVWQVGLQRVQKYFTVQRYMHRSWILIYMCCNNIWNFIKLSIGYGKNLLTRYTIKPQLQKVAMKMQNKILMTWYT